MKQMKKALVSLTLGAAMTLSLAACGGQSTPQTPTASSAPQETAAPTETAVSDENGMTDASEASLKETTPTEEQSSEKEPAPETELVYGTATLRYAEFYAGDVSSTESYDAVSSATNRKSGIFPNMHSDFVDEETNADGYRILGVKNVRVAVPADQAEAYHELNPSFTEGEAAGQYKPVTVEDGKAVYHPTVLELRQTVDNARAVLKTGSTWGDYEIDIYDNEGDEAANLLRRGREEEWPIGAEIQGVILETAEGLRVGMEHLQSIWVQPYEISFNVSAESRSNAHIAVGGAWDNIPELARLVEQTVTKITFLMPDCAYEYLFDGIYIRPAYPGAAEISAAPEAGSALITLTGIPEDLVNPTVTVTMGSGRGRSILADAVAPENGTVVMHDAEGAEAVFDPQQTYTVTVGSDNYADITAAFPMTQGQREQLEALAEQAEEILSENEDEGLAEHKAEVEALLAAEAPTSAEATALISELNSHLAPYAHAEESHGGESGQGQHAGRQGSEGGHGHG